MRPLKPEELDIVAGGAVSSSTPIYVTGTRLPAILPPTEGGSGGTGSTSPSPGTGGTPSDNCGGTPMLNWSLDDPTVQSALKTAGADEAGVERAIDSWNTIVDAANAAGIDPALLAAIGIRETDFRDISQPDGLGRGVFQIDLGAHPDVTLAEANDLTFSANYAAHILASNMATLASEFPNFTHDQLLQATADSYNFGTSNISGNPATMDQGSTGNDYGSNVMDLMEAFKDPSTGMTPGAGSMNGGC